MITEDNTELTDSVSDASAANLREKNPELFGDEPKASKLEDLTAEDLAAIAGEEDGEGKDKDDVPKPGEGVPERDPATGKFIPKERFDEVNTQRKQEREAREAAERERDELKRAAQERAEAERLAAEAKAREVHDYDADRVALDAKYDANEIDQAEYRKQLREIDKADRAQDRHLAEEAAVARVRKETQAERERAENQTAEQIAADANAAAIAFMEKPENAAYKNDPIRMAAINVQREIIYNERNGNIGWSELLDEAKARVEEYFGASKKTDNKPAETEAERVKRERLEKQARATAQGSALPARPDGGVGARATAEPEDENDISTEEYRKLPKAERDRRLGKDKVA
jgi:hypothetical protein